MDQNDSDNAAQLLAAPPRVVNVGLELFAADLRRQEGAANPQGAAGAKVIHVQWSPPAGGNAHLAGLLGKLRS
jgi:hypothetical protein